MATYNESFDGTTLDQPWTGQRNAVAWRLNGDGTATIPDTGNTYQRLDRDLGSTDHYIEAVIPRTWSTETATNADARAVLTVRNAVSVAGAYVASLQLANRTLTFLHWNGTAFEAGPATTNLDLGTTGPITVRIEASGTTVRALINGVVVKTETPATARPGTGLTRAGVGVQRGGTIQWASVRAGALSDPAPPTVNAGADAAIVLGEAFTRTAVEAGGTPTSRSWTVVSGPAQEGATLATAAALSWTPTAAGTYVLRYRAANATAAATDDVTVVVSSAAAGAPVTVVNTVVDSGASGTGRSVTVPGVRAGDDLLAVITDVYVASAGAVTATGATTVVELGAPIGAADGEANQAMRAFRVTATAAGTVVVSAPATNESVLTVTHLRDADTMTAVDRTVPRAQAPAAEQPLGPVTMPAGGGLLLGAWAGVQFTGTLTWAPPSTMVERSDRNVADFAATMVATEAVTAGGNLSRTATGTPAPDSGFAGKLIAVTGRAAAPPELVDTYTAELDAAGNLVTPEFWPREREVLVVKAVAGHSDVVLSDPTGGDLTYTMRAQSTAASYTPVRLHTAVVPAGPQPMRVTVVASGGTAGQRRDPTLVVERWAYAALAAGTPRSGATTGTGAPEATLTVDGASSATSWVVGDWNAVTAAETVRADNTVHYRRRTTAINVWAGSRVNTAPGSSQIGMTAPTGQKWTLAAVEVLPGPDPVENPDGPDTAAERYGWGDPLPSSDEFDYTGVPDPAKWGVYDGDGHDGNGTRSPAQVTVQDGYLRIAGNAIGDSGGLAHRTDVRYGRWEVRARFGAVTPGSAGESYHALLITWPDGSLPPPEWPQYGEYDWLEIEDVESTRLQAYLHYPHPNMPVEQEYVTDTTRTVDFTQWHNYAFEWVEGALRGYIDGDQWFEIDGARTGPSGQRMDSMPSGHLTIQLDNFTGSSGLQPAYYDVEYARIYPAPGGGEAGVGGGTVAAELDQSGTGRKATAGAGDNVVDLDGHGTGRTRRDGGGDAPLEVAATATGHAARRGTGRAGLILDQDGTGHGTRTGVGSVAADLDTAGAGTPGARTGTGRAALDLDTRGVGFPAEGDGTGRLELTLDAAGTGHTVRATTGTVGEVALDTAGAGHATRGGAAAGHVTVDATGTGQTRRRGVGGTDTALGTVGTGTATRAGRGRSGLTLGADAVGQAARVGGGAAAVELSADGVGTVVRDGAATAPLALSADAVGRAARVGAGASAVELSADAAGGPTVRHGRGRSGLTLSATGEGRPGPRAGRGAAALTLDEGNAGQAARTSTGAAGLEVRAEATAGDLTRAGRGAAVVALDAYGFTGVRAPRGRGRAELEVYAVGAGHPGPRTSTGRAAVAVDATGAGTGARTSTGVTAAELAAAGTGDAVRTGRGRVVLDVAATGAGRRTGRGGGAVELTLDAPADVDPLRAADGAATTGAVTLDAVGAGDRVGVGAATVAVSVEATSTAGGTSRPGGAAADLDLAATGAGRAGPRYGGGRARMALRSRGSAERRVRGRGRTVLRMGARPDRPVPGRASTASSSRAALTASQTTGGSRAR